MGYHNHKKWRTSVKCRDSLDCVLKTLKCRGYAMKISL